MSAYGGFVLDTYGDPITVSTDDGEVVLGAFDSSEDSSAFARLTPEQARDLAEVLERAALEVQP